MVWLPPANTCPTNTLGSSCHPSILTFVTLLTQYLSHSFDTKFTDSKLSNDALKNEEFDFIIVGAGSAGSVVANRLSEIKEWKILLLEAGDEEPIIADVPALMSLLLNSNLNYAYNVQSEKTACGQRSFQISAGRVMGGTSTINGRLYIRGNKQDYNDWATMVNDREWDWEHVLPYFKKSEDMRDPEILNKSPYYHGTGGYLTVDKAPFIDNNNHVIFEGWREMGFEEVDYNTGEQIGTARMQYTGIHGARQSTNGAFLRPIRGRRSNLIIRPNSQATKIIIDPTTKQTQGVEFVDLKNNETIRVFSRKEVIISSGGIESPKLLLLSGIGPVDHLQDLNIKVIKNLPVGKAIMNHISAHPFEFTIPKERTILPTGDKMTNDLVYWLNTHEGPMSSNDILQTSTFLQTKYAARPDVPDIHLTTMRSMSKTPTGFPYVPFSYYDGATISVTLLDTAGQGNLILNKNDPIWKHPIITIDYVNGRNIERLKEGSKVARELFNTETLKKNGFNLSKDKLESCKNFEFDSDEYLKCVISCKVQVSPHPVSACKMGSTNDSSAVVDSRLRVYGVEGLRVIDTSIIPVLPKGSTNAPAIMIGEKGSDMIKQDWLS